MVGRDEAITPVERSRDEVIFCATSRLVEAKGIGELIEAFKTLTPAHPDYRLWIVGDGPDANIFIKQASNTPAIVFWGHQDNPLRHLAAADIYVHPTHHEGFSLSLAEAAMLAKPMIATRVGGNPELVNEKNGVLVGVKNVPELATAMEALAKDSEQRLRLGEQSRKDFLEKYDFMKVVKREVLPLYEP